MGDFWHYHEIRDLGTTALVVKLWCFTVISMLAAVIGAGLPYNGGFGEGKELGFFPPFLY
jgi:hypothetical protein